MFTETRIREVCRQTQVSPLEAMRALTHSEGDVERAVGELNDHHHSARRTICLADRAAARALAQALVDAGIWFECEAMSNAQWRFAVAAGAYARLLALASAPQHADTADAAAVAA